MCLLGIQCLDWISFIGNERFNTFIITPIPQSGVPSPLVAEGPSAISGVSTHYVVRMYYPIFDVHTCT